jgi:hypothetical protein
MKKIVLMMKAYWRNDENDEYNNINGVLMKNSNDNGVKIWNEKMYEMICNNNDISMKEK